MSGEIGSSSSQSQSKIEYIPSTLLKKLPTEIPAKIFTTINSLEDIDYVGNSNGKVEEEDFIIALSNYKDKNSYLQNKIEQLYIEFAEKHLGKQKEVGDYLITELDIPSLTKGVTNRKKIVRDKETGKLRLTANTIIEEKDGITTVKTNRIRVVGNNSFVNHDVEFQYSREALENYIINEATDAKGFPIKHFLSIPEIRALPEEQRTEEQKNLLAEFETFLQSSIDAGVEYGMDPKFVVAIIQQEVGFKGLAKNVTGTNGKGYMQLTSAPIKDFLGYADDGKYHNLKVSQYGPEMEELLISRGFDTSTAATTLAKSKIYKDVYNYLKENKDPDFNIRLGTLVLRYYQDKAKGDVKTAARNYNGSSLKDMYARNVSNFNDKLAQTVPCDTVYLYKKLRL